MIKNHVVPTLLSGIRVGRRILFDDEILTFISKRVTKPFSQNEVQKPELAAFVIRILNQLVFVHFLKQKSRKFSFQFSM
jgi:hypothetical protein